MPNVEHLPELQERAQFWLSECFRHEQAEEYDEAAHCLIKAKHYQDQVEHMLQAAQAKEE